MSTGDPPIFYPHINIPQICTQLTIPEQQAEIRRLGESLRAAKYNPQVEYAAPPPVEEDQVNHPKHYTSHPSGIECIDVVEHMNFNIGCAVKYLWRVDTKDNPMENLRKARWYVDREIQRRGGKNGA